MTTPSTLKANIERDFGATLSAQQLWTLVKLCKHVRLRCRNNAAFNNCFNSIFQPHARFTQVNKTRADGTTYPGLSILVNGVDVTPANGDDSNE